MKTLLELSVGALGRALCFGSERFDLEALPELEIAVDVFQKWQRCLAAAQVLAVTPPPQLARQEQVLRNFATAFWRPQLLRLAYAGALPPGFSDLPLVGHRLLHLELAAPELLHLDAVAAACPVLRCLSLRGCWRVGDASLAALPRLTALEALDLGGLSALTDGAAYHVAHLPRLAALNLSGTLVTDRALQLLAYGLRVRAWQRLAGAAELPPEAAAWPALPLEHLQLEGTRVGAAGLAELEHVARLRFLDMRRTGVSRAALAPLQRRFALEFVQAAVLTSSNSVAAAVVNQDAVVCRCGCGGSAAHAGAAPSAAMAGWEAVGVQLLLHRDPLSGLSSVISLDRYPPAWHPISSSSPQPWPSGRPGAAGAAAAVPSGRRAGYRQAPASWPPAPAEGTRPGGPQPSPRRSAGSKRGRPY